MANTTNINRLSLTLNVVSIAIVGYFCFMNFTGCGSESGQTTDSTDSTKLTPPPGRTASVLATNCCNPCESNVQYDLIDGNTLKNLSGNYRPTKRTITEISGVDHYGDNDIDAGSVWFALEDLKKFICQIEHAVCDCPPEHRLGIRIYYARYPSLPPVSTTDPDYGYLMTIDSKFAFRHTVFMIPTYDKQGDADTHYDFKLNPGHAPNDVDDCFGTVGTTINDTVPVLLPDGKNHGTLCPPICDGAVFGK